MAPINNSPFAKRVRETTGSGRSESPQRPSPNPRVHPIFGALNFGSSNEDLSPTRSLPGTPSKKDKGKRVEYGDRYELSNCFRVALRNLARYIPSREEGDFRTNYHLMDDGLGSPSKRQKMIPSDSDASQGMYQSRVS